MKLFEIFKGKKREKSNKTFMERAWDLQHNLEASQKRIGKGKYGRVLKMARKPTDEEYAKTSKITWLGIMLIGGMGFLVYLLVKQVAPWMAELLGL